MNMSEQDKRLLQIRIARLFQSQYRLSDDQFIMLDKKYNIMQFLEDNYAYLHLQGDNGCLSELLIHLKSKGLNL